MSRRTLLTAAALVGSASALVFLARGVAPDTTTVETEHAAVSVAADVSDAPGQAGLPAGEPAAWLIVGGGVSPDSNEVAIEQDVALAAATLAGPGVTLFAGGSGSHGVQVLEPTGAARDALLGELGAIFSPRNGRDAVYRPTTLRVDAPATREAVDRSLAEVLRQGEGALLVHVATHGDIGESAADNAAMLWGGGALTPADLADALDRLGQHRRVRVVVAACYGGGFAEIAFRGADPALGPAETDRCGLFATPWDLESSGCGADPDLQTHEGYAAYFYRALRGLDRADRPLATVDIDFDGDGRISLLEAHTRVRIASQGIDVPTTTSERWLRQVAPADGREASLATPEEDAVVGALGARLGMTDADLVAAALEGYELRLAEVQDGEAAAAEREAAAYQRLASEMLARWPVADDPYHPQFAELVLAQRAEILAYLDTSDAAQQRRDALAELDRLGQRRDAIMTEKAPYERLLRALENRTLARRLAATGGAELTTYHRLLACERSPVVVVRDP